MQLAKEFEAWQSMPDSVPDYAALAARRLAELPAFRARLASFADVRTRNLVTTHSTDLNRPGTAPWVYDPLAAAYRAASPGEAPRGAAIGFPPLTARYDAPPAGSN